MTWRTGLLGVALAAAFGLLLSQQGAGRGLRALPLYDFVEYWAAGRLNARGEDPYDPARIEQLQRQAGHPDEPILMWNPPWALALVMPFGLLDCRTAHLLWLLLHLAALGLSADLLWRAYGGPPALRWLAWALTFSFLPTYFALTAGQVSPLLLLGAAGFLYFVRRGRDAPAGACAALLGLKPHLAYLFWPALLLWAVGRRRGRVLAGGAFAGLAALGVALLFNPGVLGQYGHALSTRPPAQYRSPTLGTLLRLALGGGSFGWQFLAILPGLAWLIPHWRRHRRDWDWARELPLLLPVCLLTAPYGAWPFDLVLLLVPVLRAASALARQGAPARQALAAGAYLALNALALAQIALRAEYLWFIWMTPALLLGYLLFRDPAPARGPAPAEACVSPARS